MNGDIKITTESCIICKNNFTSDLPQKADIFVYYLKSSLSRLSDKLSTLLGVTYNESLPLFVCEPCLVTVEEIDAQQAQLDLDIQYLKNRHNRSKSQSEEMHILPENISGNVKMCKTIL